MERREGRRRGRRGREEVERKRERWVGWRAGEGGGGVGRTSKGGGGSLCCLAVGVCGEERVRVGQERFDLVCAISLVEPAWAAKKLPPHVHPSRDLPNHNTTPSNRRLSDCILPNSRNHRHAAPSQLPLALSLPMPRIAHRITRDRSGRTSAALRPCSLLHGTAVGCCQ